MHAGLDLMFKGGSYPNMHDSKILAAVGEYATKGILGGEEAMQIWGGSKEKPAMMINFEQVPCSPPSVSPIQTHSLTLMPHFPLSSTHASLWNQVPSLFWFHSPHGDGLTRMRHVPDLLPTHPHPPPPTPIHPHPYIRFLALSSDSLISTPPDAYPPAGDALHVHAAA